MTDINNMNVGELNNNGGSNATAAPQQQPTIDHLNSHHHICLLNTLIQQ